MGVMDEVGKSNKMLGITKRVNKNCLRGSSWSRRLAYTVVSTFYADREICDSKPVIGNNQYQVFDNIYIYVYVMLRSRSKIWLINIMQDETRWNSHP